MSWYEGMEWCDMEFDELKKIVEKTIEQIYTKEAYLIKYGLSEWTISAQFHYYMRKECWKKLKGYCFDSEYNLMSKIKNRELVQKCICVNGEPLHVRPDFIIHKRDDSKGKFLWVEMKRVGGKRWENDLSRVKAVTQERVNEGGGDYVTGYAYGLGVLFRKRNVICQWYANDNKIAGRIMEKDISGPWKWKDSHVDICGCLLLERRD